MGKGFQHDPLADIELIRQNLKDRYGAGFAILKELIQNADDADATLVEFIWSPGVQSASHPLLRGPGLIALNDGRFTASDREAIQQMGLSDKLRERESIGKFGLGLKSIFHWCEAFFYFAKGPDGTEEGDILNPWSGEAGARSFHADWDAFPEDDRKAVTEFLSPILPPSEWFCVWVPLRRRDHCCSLTPIQSAYPGDLASPLDCLIETDLERKLAELVPLLAKVRTVQGWSLRGDGQLAPLNGIQLADGALRRQYRREGHQGSARFPLAGEIRGTDGSVHFYRGWEVLAAARELDGLKGSDHWPKATRIDRQTAEEINVPEKVDAHAAAVFLAHPAAGACPLAVTWASFLPLGEPVAPLPSPGPAQYTLLLHGDFFVDPGRNRPDFGADGNGEAPETETELRRRWNRHLAQLAVVPQVLPAIREFSQACLDRDATAELTQAVAQVFQISPGLTRWRGALCGKSLWAYCLSGRGGSWQLLPAETRLVGIPTPPMSDPERPGLVFPALEGVTKELHVTIDGWPRIAPTDELDDWPEHALLSLLDIEVPGVFTSQTLLNYLVSFLSIAGAQLRSDSIQRKLRSIGCRALLQVDFSSLRGSRSFVSAFLEQISREAIVCFDLEPSPAAQDIYRSLLTLPLGILPVPREFYPVGIGRDSQLGVEDAVAMLRRLGEIDAQRVAQDQADVVSSLALQIVQMCGDRRQEALGRCRDIRLFKAHNCRQQQSVLLSWGQLKEAQGLDCLFGYAPPPNREGLASFLQDAIVERVILLVDTRVGRSLFDEEELSWCNAVAAASALTGAPRLAKAEERTNLLEALRAATATNSASALFSAVRYLLHGDYEHVRDTDDLLVQPEARDHDAWTKLTDQALQILQARWRLVPPRLSSLIPSFQKPDFHLKVIDAQTVAGLLWEAGPEKIHCEQLTTSERDQAIRDIEDLNLLRRLVLHPDRAGDLHAIDPHSFTESEFRVDDVFIGLVTILRRSQSPTVWDKQRRLADSWTERAAVRVALNQPRPQEFARQILDALHNEHGIPDLSLDLKTKLKQARWLPGANGSAFAPEYVLHIKGMDDEIAPLAAASEGVFADVGALDAATTSHPAFSFVVNELMPSAGDVLDMLGALVRDDDTLESHRIGQVKLGIDNLHVLLQAFQDVPAGLMRGLSLLQKATSVVGEVPCVERLVPGLVQGIAVDRLADILDYLVERHQRVPFAQKSACLGVHALYLEAVVNETARAIVPELHLLNKRGQWRPIRELCPPSTTGITDTQVADEVQFEILRPLLTGVAAALGQLEQAAEQAQVQNEDLAQSAALLTRYFGPWEERCPRQAIAGFLSMLGDGPIRVLAEDFFDNGGLVDITRSRLEWRPVRGVTNLESWGASDSAIAVMESQRILVSLYNPASQGGVRVRNLLGQTITVAPSEVFEDLLVGERLFHAPVNNPLLQIRNSSITLRVISPDGYTERELSSLLRETARRILKYVYFQDVPNLDDVWEGFHEGEQKDIRIAQNRLAESLFLYVRQLGIHGHGAISGLLRQWDQAQRQRTEAEDLPGRDGERLRTQAESDAKESREKLKRLLDSDTEVQQLFLEAVRERIERHYQYRLSSIPFELFQNADDAVIELGEMLRVEDLSPGRRQFHLMIGPGELAIVHCGRPINAYRHGDFDGRPRGFDADLEKMLVLAASDKGVAPGLPKVTGRFGLGFKSVFLFADRAEILSGRLAFEVVGGLFPKRLGDQRLESLRQRYELVGIRHGEGTLLNLPAAAQHSSAEATARFRRLVHVLLVFSRAIKDCGVHDSRSGSSYAAWSEQVVPGAEGVAVGRLVPTNGTAEDEANALVFRLASGAMLLCLGPRGFKPLAADVPTIWVTAPTDAAEGVGFALNAPFDLDVGRAQLASHSDHNLSLADRLGHELGSALRSLARLADSNWATFVDRLGLSPDVKPYDLWESLWLLFARSIRLKGEDSEALRVVKRVLWGHPEAGVAELIKHHDVLPSGLRAPYRTLSRLHVLRHQLHGCLDERSGLFEQVGMWTSFQQKVRPGTMISGAIAADLRDLAHSTVNLRSVNLSDALTWEVGDIPGVDPVKATNLGVVVTKDLLDELRAGSQSARTEYEELQQLLARFEFRAGSGTYRQPADLVVDCGEVEADERLRVQFAPDDRTLSPEYDGTALSFFLLCRGRYQPGSQDLAQWMREASEPKARVAALCYLARGRLSREVAGLLRGSISGSWLDDLQSSPLLATLAPWERNLVLSLLDQLPALPPVPPTPPPINPGQLLERVYSWWQQEGLHRTQRYVAQVYLRGVEPRLDSDWDAIHSDLGTRREWLQLFLLGASLTLGRTRREQHRAFVEWCDDGGWLDVFARPEHDATVIVESLRDYLERGVDRLEFYYWMRLFVPLFQLATWLNEYVEVFLQLQRQQAPVDLSHLLSPNANPHLSGTGISAPPLGRTLGIGANFVLRELTRLRIVTNRVIDEHCYVPSRSVRSFLSGLGCRGLDDDRPRLEMSRSIHAFLCDHLGPERARFENHFDIPLLMLAEDPGLQSDVLNETIWEPTDEDAEEGLR